jgi:peptidyl-tRNA hydrolase
MSVQKGFMSIFGNPNKNANRVSSGQNIYALSKFNKVSPETILIDYDILDSKISAGYRSLPYGIMIVIIL